MVAQHIHILGICGTFMGGVAALAKAAGYRVTGCDANVYPPMSTQLRSLGVELVEGYSVDQLAFSPDIWVVGNVVARGNPLVEAILDRGDPYASGPEWLSTRLLHSKWVLAVSGTHGKTTTSAMLAWILESAGSSPGFLIGGAPRNFPVSARLTDSSYFVIEADEYDTAFFDKRSKFMHYRPKTAILNNIEFDHADIFSDIAAIERQFHHFVRTIPSQGRLIVNGRDQAISRVLAQGAWTPVERFDTKVGWFADEADEDGSFDVLLSGERLGRVRWDMLGQHNRQNALAAIAAARHAGIHPGAAIDALRNFQSVKRRMELRGNIRGVRVYDDFAHHPTAIKTTLDGLRGKVGEARILAVLDPRSNTMKLGAMKDQLPGSVAAADCAFVYSANLGWDPDRIFAPLGDKAFCSSDLEKLIGRICAEARSGDHILVMSNGAFGGIHEKLLKRLAE